MENYYCLISSCEINYAVNYVVQHYKMYSYTNVENISRRWSLCPIIFCTKLFITVMIIHVYYTHVQCPDNSFLEIRV